MYLRALVAITLLLTVAQTALAMNDQISTWGGMSAAVKSGKVRTWGNYQPIIPADLTNAASISYGHAGLMVLKIDGTVAVYPNTFPYVENDPILLNFPTGLNNVRALVGYSEFALALKNDGTVVAWGSNGHGSLNVPAGLSGVVAVAAGDGHALALKNDGTVVTWGGDNFNVNVKQLLEVPAGLSNVVAISAGSGFSVALKADGTVVVWGSNVNYVVRDYLGNSTTSGLSNVVAISAGYGHVLALKSDGTIAAWGGDVSYYESLLGLCNVKAISAHWRQSLVLQNDGTLVCLGLGCDSTPTNYYKTCP
ncbi:RCC1 domain-containing protein [Geotalea uraniireducens]|uniref:Alpha-tubulin suppressor and related RCC1 domain-containing protein-like protein n=1 Tax=Geotalea uraniireducens (strain Rf4) TaxID=351605 RepID=A5GCV7_GEOUR|nr:alpha-tubulin suppressor domain-containing protein [Geotalea uraniireducens]ABQ24589.1 Alpha-tubulin suppressor and related RCC1 domain-containing protein-like protein [Geotalea uraniireducens Rf4]